MPNNLPSNLKRHTAHRENQYSHKINFPDGYPMPNTITGIVRKNGVTKVGISPTCVQSGQSFTFTYASSTLKKIPGLFDHYFAFDGIEILGGQLDVVVGYGDPNTGETNVVISEGNVTIVEIDGISLINELVATITVIQQALNKLNLVDVASFTEMLTLIEPGINKRFLVIEDETQLNETTQLGAPNIIYTWENGLVFMYGIYALDPQPEFNF